MFNLMLAAFGRVRTSVQRFVVGLVIAFAALAGFMTPALAQQTVAFPVYNSGVMATADGFSWALVDYSPKLSRAGISAHVSYVSFLLPGSQKYLNPSLDIEALGSSSGGLISASLFDSGEAYSSTSGTSILGGAIYGSTSAVDGPRTIQLDAAAAQQMTAISQAGGGLFTIGLYGPRTAAHDMLIINVQLRADLDGPPVVTGISPTSGGTAGGTGVSIIGRGFTGATAVKFGTIDGVATTVVSENLITTTSPAGTGTVDITVTTPSGTSAISAADQFTYLSSNATLSALALSSGTLSPVFDAGTASYTASVSGATTSITVTPTVADADATVTVNGVSLTSGSASGAIALNVGSNTITTVVTAQDGTTTRTYTTTVTRAAPLSLNVPATSAAKVGQAYVATFSAAGGAAPYSYAVTAGALPAGLSLDADGTLSGTPTAGGTFNFTVTTTDSSTGAGTPHSIGAPFSLIVAAPSLVPIQTPALPDGQPAVAYTHS
ncbi:MAG: cadherin-like beta sandwich domain-containing protein, partial [Brevundimonas sp.]